MPPARTTDTDALQRLTPEGRHNNEMTSGVTDAAEEESDLPNKEFLCGYHRWTPKFLQGLSNPKTLLLIICFLTSVQGFAVNGINNVNTTAIERRFGLSSSRVGWVSSSYDFSAGVFVLFVSYFGAFGHKPRWLAIASIILGIGSLVMALPHFTTGPYVYSEALSQTCSVNGTAECESSGLSNYLYVLILGQALHGYAGTTMYTLGTIILDESVPVKMSPIYVGLMYGMATLGPALGYLAGGAFLDLYVDVNLGTSTDLSSEDPRWVGAWWIGFVISGCLSFLIAGLLFCFPFELPGTQKVREGKVSQAHSDGGETKANEPGFGFSVRDMPAAALLLLRNLPFLFVSLAACSEAILTAGVATFLPKFLQNQFGQTASWSALLSGFLAVPGAAGGTLMGALLCKWLKLSVKGMLTVGVCSGVTCLLVLASLFIKCDMVATAGVTAGGANLGMECNSNCSCSTQFYEPVCDQGGNLEYFSACHAGCTDLQNFSSCACFMNNTMPFKAGRCENDCSLLYVFLPLAFFFIFLSFTASVPSASATLRVVPDRLRSFGLGIQWVLIRFLGSTPGPLIFGAIIDLTCKVWQETACEEQGSCWIYDNSAMALNFFITGMCFKCLGIFFFFLSRYFYKPPPEEKFVVANSAVGLAGAQQLESADATEANGHSRTDLNSVELKKTDKTDLSSAVIGVGAN